MSLAEVGKRRQSVHIGHFDVQDHQIRVELRRLVEGDPSRSRGTDDVDVGLRLQFFRDDLPDDERIVHHQHANLFHIRHL